MDKSYRIHTSTPSDIVLNVNMKQDFDFLEVLSLKLSQEDAYKLHSSNYGVIVGRVLANDAFGVPNAKISVFIERDTSDVSELERIYPYSEVTSKDKDGRRYNLLPDYSDDDCYRIVGTFPNKRLLLDEISYIEIYEKYWKYTTVTNQAGDYMIFGVPTGSHQIHTDIDLSDIGILSQKPRDFIYKGYNMTEFDNANQFKESTNLDSLKQIISQDKSTFVYPFWGDAENGIAAITRCDVQVDYKFEPTCIFMGSIVSDNEGNAIGHKCSPSVDNGMNSQLIAGEGTIEMIRKTIDGLVEEYPIQGNRLIDSDGVWCYQIPMNLDYVGTDEYGNIVPTDNPNKGIPTRTQVRFRISKIETGDEGYSRHTAKYLVPINPLIDESEENPKLLKSGENTDWTQDKNQLERIYEFGSSTPLSCFRDLYWNNVYSVKNYIPKLQVASKAYTSQYSALKGSNLVTNQNPIPFNKLRIDVPFMYMIVCILFTLILVIISIINAGIICTINAIVNIIYQIVGFKLPFIGRPFGRLADAIAKLFIGCISLGAGLSEDNKAYYPGCYCSKGLDYADCPEGMENNCVKVNDNTELKDKIQQNLALEYKMVKLDLYQDWINGCLYMPLWYWRKRKKKTFLFGLFSRSAKNDFCDCDKTYSRFKSYVTCNVEYTDNKFTPKDLSDQGSRWHKSQRDMVRISNGVIKGVKNKDDLTVYYYTAMQTTPDYNNNGTVVRLYATDIILLGNINENNLYGIPQLFKALPSTTANIPPIATVQESNNNDDSLNTDSDLGDGEDSGTTTTTGMDWGARGGDETPAYSTGLFLDLACTYAASKAKSCINVERLSELGVNLDMTYSASYGSGNNVKTGVMNADGFISKTELDDLDNRCAFATLNHIGFIPQAYQDSVGTGECTTQVEDNNTNYLIPKFKYLFPVDFDGRMQSIMEKYKGNFEQAMYDEYDDAYVTFRMGAEDGSKTDNSEHRIRHFYNIRSNTYSMPLFNNSYYFYFGINKGSTAIDKFNSMFMAECFQNVKEAFSVVIDARGRSVCPSMYEDNKMGYGHITVSLDDIVTPYTYALYDSVGNTVIKESDMSATTFTIGNGTSGSVIYQITGEKVDNMYGDNGLTNQTYNLVLTDDNDKTVSKRIELSIPDLSLNYSTYKLGTKFYNTTTTKREYICSEETDLYGKIIIDEVYVDGIRCKFKKPTSTSGGTFWLNPSENEIVVSGITVTDNNESGSILKDSGINLFFRLQSLEGNTDESICPCSSGITMTDYINNGSSGPVVYVPENADTCSRVILKGGTDSEGSGMTTLQFDVYQPSKYLLSVDLDCDGDVSTFESSTSEIVNVHNGENFNTFLNGMPLRFMLGTTNDNSTMSVSNTSKFYYTTAVTSVTDSHISGWYGVHQEDSYQFGRGDLKTVEQNRNVWEDFVEVTETMSTPLTRLNILKYKFEKMFSLSDAVYHTGEFRYTSVGGITPVLFRSVAPQYSNDKTMLSVYEFNDNNTVTVPQEYPNIVGNNYSGHSNVSKVSFNKLYGSVTRDNEKYIGNYFAAFSNNGGYINKTTLSKKMAVVKLPNYADISPKGTPKKLGTIETGNIRNELKYVHTTGNHRMNGTTQAKVNPYLRALTVDRRISYDLTIIGPIVGSSFSLYESGATLNYDRFWKNTRIMGQIYGGVEMAYDNGNDYFMSGNTRLDITAGLYPTSDNKTAYGRIVQNYKTKEIIAVINDDDLSSDYNTFSANGKTYKIGEDNVISGITDSGETYEVLNSIEYNIITANTTSVSGSVVSATANTALEYSYQFDSGASTDAITKYNPDPDTKKKFYEFSLGGTDISDYLWSDFNRKIGSTSSGATPYVFKYPANKRELYNGDFNRENAIKNNGYPTKRYIDVCGIPSMGTYNLNITSCAYPSKVILDNVTNSLSCSITPGDGEDIDFSFNNAIQFIETDDVSSSKVRAFFNISITTVAGNAMYTKYGNETVNGTSYHKFIGASLYLSFKIIRKGDDGNFDVYTAYPTVIRVLPYTNGMDGITYIKTACQGGESGTNFPDKTLYDAIKNVTVYQFDGRHKSSPSQYNTGDTVYPSDFDIWRDEWFEDKYGNRLKLNGGFIRDDDGDKEEYIPDDDTNIAKVIYDKAIKLDGNSANKVFTILVTRVYISSSNDMLNKRIVTYEFGDLYDCRDMLLTADTRNCYVTLEQEEVEKEGEGGQTTTETVDSFFQTLGFKTYVSFLGEPKDMKCQIFKDFETMRFSFVFAKNASILNGNGFNKLDCSDVSAKYYSGGTLIEDEELYDKADAMELFLTVQWTSDMGVLGANNSERNNRMSTYLLIRTSSGFVYNLPFILTYNGKQQLPTQRGEQGKVYSDKIMIKDLQ